MSQIRLKIKYEGIRAMNAYRVLFDGAMTGTAPIARSYIIAINKALNHAFRSSLILLQRYTITLQERIRLHKHFPWFGLSDHFRSHLSPVPIIHVRHSVVKFRSGLQVCRRLEDVQLLQEVVDGFTAVRLDFISVEIDLEIREVFLGVFELAELWAGGQERLQDGKAGSHVRLAPFARVRIPELQRSNASSCHL